MNKQNRNRLRKRELVGARRGEDGGMRRRSRVETSMSWDRDEITKSDRSSLAIFPWKQEQQLCYLVYMTCEFSVSELQLLYFNYFTLN